MPGWGFRYMDNKAFDFSSKKGFFAQKRPNLARNWHFWPLLAHFVPCWWVGWWLWRGLYLARHLFTLSLLSSWISVSSSSSSSSPRSKSSSRSSSRRLSESYLAAFKVLSGQLLSVLIIHTHSREAVKLRWGKFFGRNVIFSSPQSLLDNPRCSLPHDVYMKMVNSISNNRFGKNIFSLTESFLDNPKLHCHIIFTWEWKTATCGNNR